MEEVYLKDSAAVCKFIYWLKKNVGKMKITAVSYTHLTSAKKNHADKDIVVLTATSGDTGKAALAGFADVPGTKIIVFYPKNGVSPIQEKQMVTQKGDNTLVVGIHGNFDDAQTCLLYTSNEKCLQSRGKI